MYKAKIDIVKIIQSIIFITQLYKLIKTIKYIIQFKLYYLIIKFN